MKLFLICVFALFAERNVDAYKLFGHDSDELIAPNIEDFSAAEQTGEYSRREKKQSVGLQLHAIAQFGVAVN